MTNLEMFEFIDRLNDVNFQLIGSFNNIKGEGYIFSDEWGD